MAMIEAKNGNPGTGEPSKKKRPMTNDNTPNPKNAKIKPIILAICNGITCGRKLCTCLSCILGLGPPFKG